MTNAELMTLKPGDMVRSAQSGNAYIVTYVSGGVVLASRCQRIESADDWQLIAKSRIVSVE